jgi:outer membrane protein
MRPGWGSTATAALLACQVVCGVALADEPPAARPPAAEAPELTLKDARAMALQNHPKISAADFEAQASREVVSQARAGFLPNLTFNTTGVLTGAESTRIAAGQLSNPAIYERAAAGVTVLQVVTDFGKTSHLVGSTKLRARAQEAIADATKESILLQVDVAFYSALKAQSVLAVARQTLDTRRSVRDQVDALAKNKLRSDLDLSFAAVDYETARLLVAKSENDLDAAFASLATALGDPKLRSFRLVEEPLPTAPSEDADALIREALAQRPDLAGLRLERDASVEYASAQKALARPILSVFGSAGYTPTGDPAQFEDHYAAGGINLSLPAYDGGLNAARSSEAELRSRAAGENLRDAENRVMDEVRTGDLNTRYALERLDLTQKVLDNARHAYELAELRYRLGSTSIVELSQAQLNRTQAEIDDASAKYEYQIQRAILDYEIGLVPQQP